MRINVKDYFALSLKYLWWFNAKPRVLVMGFVTLQTGLVRVITVTQKASRW